MNKDFVKCGIAGCCLELMWTCICGIKKKDERLIGQTSLWMFPIYGMAAFIKPISRKLKRQKKTTVERGLIYALGIYTAEYTMGTVLKKSNCCPWDYSKSRYNIKGVIRLDYAPLWFATGLLYENILNKNQ